MRGGVRRCEVMRGDERGREDSLGVIIWRGRHEGLSNPKLASEHSTSKGAIQSVQQPRERGMCWCNNKDTNR